jgi:hypothetical protein
MPTFQASVRVRPIRLAFAVEPQDRSVLREVFQLNTALWGGMYNFIIPIPRKTPTRYRERFMKGPSANELVNGLIDAFQPDFIVETKPGIASKFDRAGRRLIQMAQILARDDDSRCTYGIDMRSVCAALYDTTFKFVQRHPPKIVIPRSTDPRFELLFAATFGEFASTGTFADCATHYQNALDAKDEAIAPVDLHRLLKSHYMFPLRIGRYELDTKRTGWAPDPQMFYMDETSAYDLIEFWNLRAIGWNIRPLPCSLAEALKEYCEQFIVDVYKPYPPPSNAFHNASFLCSRSCSFERMQSFVATLKRPTNDAVTIDPRVPRIWDEWARSADHAEPQSVTHDTRSVDASVLGDSIHLRTVLPEFAELSGYAAKKHACANVLESVPGGAEVIPWQNGKLESLTGPFSDDELWVAREGIVTTAGEYFSHRSLRAPSPINVFKAFANSRGLELKLSPAGQTCGQVIASLGGLQGVRLIANDKILNMLDRLAHDDLEIELAEDEPKTKRRLRLVSAPYKYVREMLMRVNGSRAEASINHLSALLSRNVLRLGMRIQCTECRQKNWFSIDDLSASLRCSRCLQQFEFPAGNPPRDAWAYRVLGPFATENYAHGSYSVAAALHFLSQKVAKASTWIPSFEISGGSAVDAEADFGMLLRLSYLSYVKGPHLILGECKTFGSFLPKDFARARSLAKLFPGAILCFATLRAALSPNEKREISRIATSGRTSLKTGQQTNPVLVLTSTELFGQYKIGDFTEDYGARFKYAHNVFLRSDLQDICDLTLQVHVGMESYHDWLGRKRTKRTPTPPEHTKT